MEFKSLGIIEPILRSLHEEGYSVPTPIQAQAIPIVLQEKDLLGVAQTGTGKTAAFAIPILQLLSSEKSHTKRKTIRSLILTPTRELAVQIDESFKAYGRHLRMSSVVIFGGVSQKSQTNALRNGVDIVVATPGRLLDLMEQGFVDLRHVRIFVLDEADRMLDMGFSRDVKKILTFLPQNRQSLFFSATMPPAIVKLADSILQWPIKVEVTPVTATVDLISQTLYYVDKGRKLGLLMQLLENPHIKTALVFTRTKHGADGVVRTLARNQISAEAIHGNKAQNTRQRSLANFKAQKIRVLVATDIAARGIDVDDLEYVINYEIPNVPETYVHRIGRTGRAGASGTAISFCAPDEKSFIRDIEKLIGKRIPVAHDHLSSKAGEQDASKYAIAAAPPRHRDPRAQPQERSKRPPANSTHRDQPNHKPQLKEKSQRGLSPEMVTKELERLRADADMYNKRSGLLDRNTDQRKPDERKPLERKDVPQNRPTKNSGEQNRQAPRPQEHGKAKNWYGKKRRSR